MFVRGKSAFRRLAVPALCLLALSWPALAAGDSAAETEAKPAGPHDPLIRSEMLRIQNMIANAQGKLRNNVIGFHGEAGPGAKQRTLTEQCCSMNIERMREAVERLDTRLREMAACHQGRGATDQALATQIALNDLAQIARGVDLFAKANTRQQAGGVAGALTRAFNLLRESVEALEDCGESRIDEPTEDDGRTSESR